MEAFTGGKDSESDPVQVGLVKSLTKIYGQKTLLCFSLMELGPFVELGEPSSLLSSLMPMNVNYSDLSLKSRRNSSRKSGSGTKVNRIR